MVGFDFCAMSLAQCLHGFIWFEAAFQSSHVLIRVDSASNGTFKSAVDTIANNLYSFNCLFFSFNTTHK